MLSFLTSYVIPMVVFAAMLAVLWRFYRSMRAPQDLPADKPVGLPTVQRADTAST